MSQFVVLETRLYNGLGAKSTRLVKAGTVIGDGTDIACDDALGAQLEEQGFVRRRMVEGQKPRGRAASQVPKRMIEEAKAEAAEARSMSTSDARDDEQETE